MHLVAENLAARRGDALLFRDISFDIAAGSALIVTGPNGSGKSTLLRVVAGLITAESGVVRITGGVNPDAAVCESCHYLGHRNAMKRELTVAENLLFWKRFMGDSPGGSGMDVDEAAEAVGLPNISHLPFGYLSAGQQRRMAIARLLVAHRPVWLLDEPTAALDAAADDMFAGLVSRHLSSGGLVLAATHQPLGLTQSASLVMRGFEDDEDFA